MPCQFQLAITYGNIKNIQATDSFNSKNNFILALRLDLMLVHDSDF